MWNRTPQSLTGAHGYTAILRNEGKPVVRSSQDEAVSAVHIMMVGYPATVAKKRLTFMLQCAIDDSGSDSRPDGMYVLAGYLMEHPRWEAFTEWWHKRLQNEPYPVECFKMSDAVSGEGFFEGIRQDFREATIQALATVIHESLPVPVVCQMRWKDYNEIVKGRVDSRLDNPYAVLFFKSLRSVSELQIRSDDALREEFGNYEFPAQPVNFVFDEQGKHGLNALSWLGPLKATLKEPHKTILSNTPQFKNDCDFLPLQAADMLAWHVRRVHEHPDEKLRSQTLNRITPEGYIEYTVSRDELETIAYAFKIQVDTSTLPPT